MIRKSTYTGEPRKKSYPSRKKVILAGTVVQKGEELGIDLNAKVLLRHFLKTYAHAGDYVSMTVELKRPKRSAVQNNFYHLYLSLVALSSGHTLLELKAWVRETILAHGVSEVYGETIRVTKSSADLNISEFAEMMNTLEEKTGIPIPNPEPFNLPLTQDEYGKLKVEQAEKYREMTPKIKKTKKKK